MSGPTWAPIRQAPAWLVALEPATTGLLGQEGVKLWTCGDEAALGIRAGGVVYPVFVDPTRVPAPEGLRSTLRRVSESWCLMGPASWVEACTPLMPPSVVQHRVDYEFLVRRCSPSRGFDGLGPIRKVTASDLQALVPLQEAYEKEEVLFDPADYHALASRMNLSKLIRQQEIVATWDRSVAVAKAGTNALTPRWAQLGGVYTRAEHRGRGHQKRLLSMLLDLLADQGRGACLFVKKANQPALALYRGLAFEPSGPFLILYGNRTD